MSCSDPNLVDLNKEVDLPFSLTVIMQVSISQLSADFGQNIDFGLDWIGLDRVASLCSFN